MGIKTGICNTFGLGKEASFGAGQPADIFIPCETFEVTPETESEVDDDMSARK